MEIPTKERLRWIDAQLISPWVTETAGRRVGYAKDLNGFVHLRGVIDAGTVWTTAFYLPPEFRPQQLMWLSTVLAASDTYYPGNLEVTTAGAVIPGWTIGGASFLWFSLDGISFHTGL